MYNIHVCVYNIHVCVYNIHVCVYNIHVCVYKRQKADLNSLLFDCEHTAFSTYFLSFNLYEVLQSDYIYLKPRKAVWIKQV